MRIVILTDAWYPQVNGVVRTYETTISHLASHGHEVNLITPQMFRSVPCPTYPEIRLALFVGGKVARLIEAAQPACVHIATEGPLGLAARKYCVKHGIPFTTTFHTKFPEYIRARIGLPLSLGYRLVKWFHAPSSAVMVATQSIEDELRHWGVANIRRWTRGVDTERFHPRKDKNLLDHLPRPVSLFVGRVAVEKNLDAFLGLDLPGTKLVVGDGPQRAEMQKKYPDAVFVGAKSGDELAAYYAASDVFVFPSLTDTFGLVLLEALACGVPVAAYPVAGPKDVLGDAPVGVLDFDLKSAVIRALAISPEVCRDFALTRNWDASVQQFEENLAPLDPASPQTRTKPTGIYGRASSGCR
jgi:glycosyltransferase involved in cell wall biosynthesis